MAGVPIFVRPLPLVGFYSVANQITSNPATNLGEFQYGGMTWRSSGPTGLSMTIDLGSAQTVDFVAMLGASALAGTTIAINMGATQANAESGAPSFTTGAQPFISPSTTGRTLYNSFAQFGSAQTFQWLNFSIAGHTGDFEAAFLVVGKVVQPSMYYEPEWEAGPLDLSTITIARNGVPEIAPGQIQRTIGFTLGWQTEAEFQTQMQPLVNAVGKVNPVYLAFDPAATTYRQDRTYFGRFTDALRTKRKGWNRFERAFALQSMI